MTDLPKLRTVLSPPKLANKKNCEQMGVSEISILKQSAAARPDLRHHLSDSKDISNFLFGKESQNWPKVTFEPPPPQLTQK